MGGVRETEGASGGLRASLAEQWRECSKRVSARSAHDFVRRASECVGWVVGSKSWEMRVVAGDREQPVVHIRFHGVGELLVVCSTSERVCYPVYEEHI